MIRILKLISVPSFPRALENPLRKSKQQNREGLEREEDKSGDNNDNDNEDELASK